jgi:hypothetical protein
MALLLGSILLASCAPAGTAAKSTPPAASPASSPSLQASSPLPLAKHWALGPVVDVAVSTEAAYVLYAPADSTGEKGFATTHTRLARIDRSSGLVMTAGPYPFAIRIAVAGSVVWIGARNQYPATPIAGSSTLIGVDGKNLRLLRRLTLPAGDAQQAFGSSLASNAATLWVAYGATIYRLTGDTGATVGSQAIAGVATSIAVDPFGQRLYVGIDSVPAASAATITAFDAATLKPLLSATTGGGDLGGPHLAAVANDVWVSYATGMLGQVEHRQASNLAQVPMASAMHTNGVQVFGIAGMVWVADAMASQLMCLDTHTGAVRASWETPQGGVIDGDRSMLYFGDITGVGSVQPDPRCF